MAKKVIETPTEEVIETPTEEVIETPTEEVEGLIALDALRTCKILTKGEVLGKFEISKEDFEIDEDLQRFIEIGFIVEA